MCKNYIWSYGSNSKDMLNLEHLFTAITPMSTLTWSNRKARYSSADAPIYMKFEDIPEKEGMTYLAYIYI